jgi:hypothetical protein
MFRSTRRRGCDENVPHAFSKDETHHRQKNLSVSSTHTPKPSGYCDCIFTVARQPPLSEPDTQFYVDNIHIKGCCRCYSTPDRIHEVQGPRLTPQTAIPLYRNPSRHNRPLPNPPRHTVSRWQCQPINTHTFIG